MLQQNSPNGILFCKPFFVFSCILPQTFPSHPVDQTFLSMPCQSGAGTRACDPGRGTGSWASLEAPMPPSWNWEFLNTEAFRFGLLWALQSTQPTLPVTFTLPKLMSVFPLALLAVFSKVNGFLLRDRFSFSVASKIPYSHFPSILQVVSSSVSITSISSLSWFQILSVFPPLFPPSIISASLMVLNIV